MLIVYYPSEKQWRLANKATVKRSVLIAASFVAATGVMIKRGLL